MVCRNVLIRKSAMDDDLRGSTPFSAAEASLNDHLARSVNSRDLVVETSFVSGTFGSGWWWLVAINFIFPYIGNDHPNWLSYFSEGFKPPTRNRISVWNVLWKQSLWSCEVTDLRWVQSWRIKNGRSHKCLIFLEDPEDFDWSWSLLVSRRFHPESPFG